jgi:hypothetical protein
LKTFQTLTQFTLMMDEVEPRQPGTRLQKRRFTATEDAALQHLVKTLGRHNWEQIAQALPDRSPRQCRERYDNYLAKLVSILPWTRDDDERLLRIARDCGHHWTEMARYFPGRSPNNLKNRWHKALSKGRLNPWNRTDCPIDPATQWLTADETLDSTDMTYDDWDPPEDYYPECPSDGVSAL